MKYVLLRNLQYLLGIHDSFHSQSNHGHAYTLLLHNITHCFYLSFIHLLFAKSFEFLSNNLLDILSTIKWFFVINSSINHKHQVVILPFGLDYLSLLQLFLVILPFQ